jgi:hypothetical protein
LTCYDVTPWNPIFWTRRGPARLQFTDPVLSHKYPLFPAFSRISPLKKLRILVSRTPLALLCGGPVSAVKIARVSLCSNQTEFKPHQSNSNHFKPNQSNLFSLHPLHPPRVTAGNRASALSHYRLVLDPCLFSVLRAWPAVLSHIVLLNDGGSFHLSYEGCSSCGKKFPRSSLPLKTFTNFLKSSKSSQIFTFFFACLAPLCLRSKNFPTHFGILTLSDAY